MFLIKLYHFIFGYMTIKIIGLNPEKFINILINMQSRFWGVKKISETSDLHIKMPARFYKNEVFDEISAKTHLTYEIISKRGLRFFLERHKHRLGIYMGVIIGVALIYISTFFIWEVKVVKSDYNNNEEIIEILEKLGCKEGVLKKSLDILQLQNKAVLTSNGKITWIAINIKGTIANVEIKKREDSTKVNDYKTPVNIVASKSGKIIYIETYDGEKIAAADNSIQKGGLLISGVVNSDTLGMRIEHAAGKVLAETTRTIEIAIPLVSTGKYYTETIINKKSLSVFGKNLNLYLKNDIFIKKYDKIKETKNITLFNAIILPIKISTSIYKEFVTENIKIDEKTAKDIAISKINSIIDNRFGCDENIVEIKSRSCEREITDDYFYMKCTVECIENIAKEVPFDTNIKTEN